MTLLLVFQTAKGIPDKRARKKEKVNQVSHAQWKTWLDERGKEKGTFHSEWAQRK